MKKASVEVFAGTLELNGEAISVEFETPAHADQVVKDAAFLAALAQQGAVSYVSVGTMDAPPPVVLNDRYAARIIGDAPERYTAIEIHGVRDIGADQEDPEGTCCEVDNDDPQFYSVYARLAEGGIECVGDFKTHMLAAGYAEELHLANNWPVYDFASQQGAGAANRFFAELLDAHETLTGIADAFGPRTLADLMYLHSAVLKDGYVDAYPGESHLLDVVSALPSGHRWRRFIKVEQQLAAA